MALFYKRGARGSRRGRDQRKDSKPPPAWDLNPSRPQILLLPRSRGGRSCQSAGGGERARASSRQRALTTAGDFFLQRALSQRLPRIFFPPAEQLIRVGPLPCGRDGSSSGLQHHCEQRLQQCSVFAGGDRLRALLGDQLRRDASGTENRASSVAPEATLLGSSSRPWLKPAATSPSVASLGRGLRAAAAAGRGATQTPSPWDSGTPCGLPIGIRSRLRS